MASYKITCTDTLYDTAHGHEHITGVGASAGDKTAYWTVQDVRKAIKSGDIFYTVSPGTSKIALVERYTCKVGNREVKTIRSAADATKENNLDNLAACGK
ncbi:MAG: DUF3892 domain-containing protein [Acidimicrobiales bacterium]|jgi:hypothetical protein